MALSKISFNKSNSNTGGGLTSEDYISGLVAYLAAPAFSDVKQFFSEKEAVTAGIVEGSVEHYHIKEFFRQNPSASLYTSLVPLPASGHTFSEVTDLVRESEGRIRQAGVFTSEPYADSMVTTLQGVADTLAGEGMNASFLLAANMVGADLALLTDITTSLSPNVSVVIGQDGGNEGASLFASKGYSITCLGAALGATSAALVSESIANVEKFNVASAELDKLAFANGTSYKSVTRTLLDQLDTKGYIFAMKYPGLNGTFFNGSYTAEVPTSDFSTIEGVRTIDKAIRGVRKVLLPKLNTNLLINPENGQLALTTVRTFEAIASRPLEQMVIDRELSGYDVIIDPKQNVNITKELAVEVKLVRMGIARNIKINIGFSLTAAQ
jgi:hypothetical protein